ncbi:hypothetical protein OG474_00225 [Kribbella sp. NBC_01505]|uniref:hypothetical protein n=1 Tax=Kribbella sp. NBC_01505 TaxID=2903580 RepID=UPI00386AAECD
MPEDARRARTLVAVGALLGVAWTAALRAFMIQLVGAAESRFTWYGTFVGILLPGAIVGGLLAWSEYRRRIGLERRRLLVCAPLIFGVTPLTIPGAVGHLLKTGEGSASFMMTALAMLAGYSLTNRSPLGVRIPCAVVGFALVPGMLIGYAVVPALEPGAVLDPQRSWTAVLFCSLFVLLAIACAVPHRRASAAS